MNDLLIVEKNNPMAASNVIAAKFGKRHDHVMDAIRKLKTEKEFWLPNFRESKYTVRGQEYDCYLMTRDGFSILCMGFTGKKALQWKIKFIAAFNAMEQRLIKEAENKKDPDLIELRLQSKIGRREETDVIKEFVEYATAQGSTKANFYYSNITRATYKALGLMVQKKPKLRDTMDCYEMSELILAERIARTSLKKYMDLGRNYKDIYESVKDDLVAFGSGLKIE